MLDTKFCLNDWVPALRSGNYKQTTGWLHTIDHEVSCYCCLGVAAELKGVTWTPGMGGSLPRSDGHDIVFECQHNGDTAYSGLPETISQQIGILGEGLELPVPDSMLEQGDYYKVFPWNGDLISVQKYYVNNESGTVWAIDLAALNDEGWSFDQIADIIEAVAKEWERVEAE